MYHYDVNDNGVDKYICSLHMCMSDEYQDNIDCNDYVEYLFNIDCVLE